jgi:hypothetical protein
MGIRVDAYVKEYRKIWENAAAVPPPLTRCFSLSEKKRIERDFSAFTEKFIAGSEMIPELPEPGSSAFCELTDSLRLITQKIMAKLDVPFGHSYDRRFSESTRVFLNKARVFDPDMDIASVYQALRNVWIMNTLQYCLRKPVECTESVFSYSMIYPYLDNLLDDNAVVPSKKMSLLQYLQGKTILTHCSISFLPIPMQLFPRVLVLENGVNVS